MSYIEPPTLTNLRKRKRSARSASVASSVVSHLPRDAIDPHSYGPSARRQLVVAGLSHSDRLPTDYVYDFPHRPLPDGLGDHPTAKNSKSQKGNGSEYDDGGDDIDTDDSDDDTENSESGMCSTTEDDEGDQTENAARLAVKQRKLRRREARRRRNALRMQRAYDQNVGVLAAIVQRGLQESEHGTIPSILTATGEAGQLARPIGLVRAKRAFGLLIRTEVKGKPVDLRRNYLWAMGAEILMREGEDGPPPEISGKDVRSRRWGLAANLPRVRAYYEDLIQQHPYNRLWPRSVSALTFWPAMAGTELYSIYAEAQLAMERLDGKAERKDNSKGQGTSKMHVDSDDDEEEVEEEEDSDEDDHSGDEFHEARYIKEEDGEGSDITGSDNAGYDSDGEDRHSSSGRGGRRNHPDRLAREDIRHAALDQARDLARRMDAAIANAPYATSPEMLRLRGMVALYMGDLAIVTPPRTQQETQEGQRLRAQERSRARARFARLLEVDRDIQTGRYHKRGGVPDTVVDAYIEKMARGNGGSNNNSSDEEDDTADYPMSRPVFTSLRI